MDVLENNVIGGFIFALGTQFGIRKYQVACEPIGVELLQQTPLDTTLGDVLVANAKIVRLIEFKREKNKSPKEFAKYTALLNALNDQGHRDDLVRISRVVHWLVVSNFDKMTSSRVVPYLDMKDSTDGVDLLHFITKMADDLVGLPMNEDDLAISKLYIEIVGRFAGEGKAGGTTGGLLFVVHETGAPRFLIINDVRELAMAPQQVMKAALEAKLELERQEEKMKLTQQRKARIRGHSMGM